MQDEGPDKNSDDVKRTTVFAKFATHHPTKPLIASAMLWGILSIGNIESRSTALYFARQEREVR